MYHPGGDVTQPPKEAPSALNTVIVPNVNLPKVSQAQKSEGSEARLTDNFIRSRYTSSTTSTARKVTRRILPFLNLGAGVGSELRA